MKESYIDDEEGILSSTTITTSIITITYTYKLHLDAEQQGHHLQQCLEENIISSGENERKNQFSIYTSMFILYLYVY